MVARFSPPELPLEEEDTNIQKVIVIQEDRYRSMPDIFRTTKTRAFSTNKVSRFASVVFDCILGHLPLSSTVDSVLGSL